MTEVTIIYEINCEHISEAKSKDTGHATLWIIPGIRKEGSFSGIDSYNEINDAMKFIGPIDMKYADIVYESLKSLFIALGIEYYFFVTADD